MVEEARKAGDEHARRLGNDLAAICRDLREGQERSERKVVRLERKRPCRAG